MRKTLNKKGFKKRIPASKVGVFEFEPKSTRITIRVPVKLLAALKQRAKQKGINYQKLLRQAVEYFLSLS